MGKTTCVWSGRDVVCGALVDLLHHNRMPGKPTIHGAAACSSLRSVHVLLLSTGADETAVDHQGACAKDCIGLRVSEDKQDPKKMAAVYRMLAPWPAFRACSWPSVATSLGPKAPRLVVRIYRLTTSETKRFSDRLTHG